LLTTWSFTTNALFVLRAFSFPFSLSVYSSYTLLSLCNLAFLCPLLALISNILLALSLPPLVPSIARSLPCTSAALYHALQHHHSPPEITSSLSLSDSPHTPPTTLFAFLTISFVEGVAQVLELAHSFCFFFISVSAFPPSFLPSSNFIKYSSHICIVISSLTDSFFFLSQFMHFHTSFSVLISFISLSSLLLLFLDLSAFLSLSLSLSVSSFRF
jgi:hypothetical protein